MTSNHKLCQTEKWKSSSSSELKLLIMYFQQLTDFANVFTSLLPPSSDHVMIHLGDYNTLLCNLSHATDCVGVCTNRTIQVTSQMSQLARPELA